MNPTIQMTTAMIINSMSDAEILSFYQAVLLGQNPSKTLGYQKGKDLLSQNNGTKMHPETEEVFLVLAEYRIDQMK